MQLFLAAEEHEDLVFYTSGGIGGKADVFLRFIAGDAFDESDSSDGDQIVLVYGLGVIFFNNMRHQPHIPLYQNIARFQVAAGAAGEVGLLLLRAERLGEGSRISCQMQG